MKKLILLTTLLFSTASKANPVDGFFQMMTYRSDNPAAQFAGNIIAIATGVAAGQEKTNLTVGLPVCLAVLFALDQKSLPRHLFFISMGLLVEKWRQKYLDPQRQSQRR